MSGNRTRIALQRADRGVLEQIQKLIGFGSVKDTIAKIKDKEYDVSEWSTTRVEFARYLQELGLTSNKSLTCQPPAFIKTTEQLAGFLLGYFEGDGHIRMFHKKGKEKQKPEMIMRFYSGSKIMLEWIKDKTSELGVKSGSVLSYARKDHNPEHNLIFNCRQAAKLGSLMYSSGIVGLMRKHQVFVDWTSLPLRSVVEYKTKDRFGSISD